jgi:N-acetylglucosaminyl-diphospho-decaprenol L-rhamnosyltransferase
VSLVAQIGAGKKFALYPVCLAVLRRGMSIEQSAAKPVTVSIVSHGQLALIAPLLAQLNGHSHASIAKVLLTINIPESEAPGLESFRFPIERIENAAPRGFGANHNQAFARCKSEWFLALNPDIRLDDDVLAPMLALAVTEAGVMTPRIIEPGNAAPEAHRAMLTPWEILTRRRADYVAPTVPVWIPGLFMLFRSRAFAEVGGFDERFFMYAEDFDICARLRLAGWKIVVAPDLLALHDARRSAHKDVRHFLWFVSSVVKVWLSSAFWRYRRLLGAERSP